MTEKTRIDVYLYEKGLANSRSHASSIVMAGNVYVNNQKALKPGMTVTDNDLIDVRGPSCKYVSRGGLKLEKALEIFNISVKDKICLDIGASTGGFTDCMLQNGAKIVYAVDVGYGQLDWKLRNNEKVINLEKTNIRYATKTIIPDEIDFASVDVSFISLKLILPVLKLLLSDNGEAVCLIKPQFEAGRKNVGKNGVVREPEIHLQVINQIKNYIEENEFCLVDLSYSPIKGPKGNIEYLVFIKRKDYSLDLKEDNFIKNIVDEAHKNLNERVV